MFYNDSIDIKICWPGLLLFHKLHVFKEMIVVCASVSVYDRLNNIVYISTNGGKPLLKPPKQPNLPSLIVG